MHNFSAFYITNQWLITFYNRLKAKWALTISVGLVLAFFVPILLTGRVISPTSAALYNAPPWSVVYPDKTQVSYQHFGDVIDFYFPTIIFTTDWLKKGILPLWNPTISSGQPAIGSIEFLLSPLNWLYLLMPLELAFTWHAIMRLLITVFFTFLLGRELNLRNAASLLAALVFTFNGFHIVWLGWPHTSEIILLPVILWLILKAFKTGQDRYHIILTFVTSVLLVSGFLPIAGYVLYAAMGFTLFLLWNLFQTKALPFRVLQIRITFVGLAIVAGLLLSAIYLLPLSENLLQSGYSSERAKDTALYQNFYLPWWQTILYLIPGYYGGISTPYWGSVNLVETSGYVGVASLVLALIALERLRYRAWCSPGYLYSLGLTGVSLSVTYGLKPLSTVITMLPGLQLAINTRLIGVAAFGLAFLAAYGLEFLQNLASQHHRFKALVRILGASLLLASLAIGVEIYWSVSPSWPAAFNKEITGVFSQPSSLKVTMWSALHHGSWPMLLSGAMFGGQLVAIIALCAAYQRTLLSPVVTFFALISLITVDLFSFAYWYLPVSQLSKAYPVTPVLQMALTQSQPDRFLAISGHILPGNTTSVYNLYNAGGHSIYHPARYIKYLSLLDPNVWNRKAHGTNILVGQHISDFESRLIDLLSVRYILDVPVPKESLKERFAASQTISEIAGGEIYGSIQQGQTFVATAANLQQVDLLLATYARTNHQEVIFHLKTRPDTPEELVRISIPASQIVDNQWASFTFTPIKDSAGRSFYFYLESPSSRHGDAITIWSTKGDNYPIGQRYLNGKPVEGDLAFRAIANSYIPSKFNFINLAPEMVVFENTMAMPRAYAVPHSLVLTDEAEILRRLQSPDFDPYQTVIIEETPPVDKPKDNFAFNSEYVQITHYEPNRIEIEATLPASGWVVLTDVNYPGWCAQVDGQPIPVYQANYLFRAVPLHAGKHTVIFYFQPTIVLYGVIISFVTLLGLLIIVGFRWRNNFQKHRNKRKSVVVEPEKTRGR